MKKQKKELAASIAETVQDKLKDSVTEARQLKKAIKKTAKNLAEKIIRISVKQDKRLKKENEAKQSEIKEDKGKKKNRKPELTAASTTEIQSPLIQE